MKKIKKDYLETIIGFNNSVTPLGERKDLNLLFEIANNSNNKMLLELFEVDEKVVTEKTTKKG